MNRLKKKQVWALAGAVIVIAVGGAFLTTKLVSRGVVSCTDPAYQSISNGMSKDKITELLGAPTIKRVKDSPEQDFFSQGEREASIKEGWIYNLQRGYGGAEIYFDSSAHVNGKGCGNG